MKPRLFIACSKDTLRVANAVHTKLEKDGAAEVTVWDQGIFGLGRYVLEELLETLGNSDFGVFVFAPDDTATIKRQDYATVRDNVLFELGMFVGRLGPERCFVLIPKDLLGLTCAVYDQQRVKKEPLAAVASACFDIERAMERASSRSVSRDASWDVGKIYEADSRLLGYIKPDSKIRVCRIVAYTCKVAYDWRGILQENNRAVEEMRILARDPQHIEAGRDEAGAIPSSADRINERRREIRHYLLRDMIDPLNAAGIVKTLQLRFYRAQPVLRGVLIDAGAETDRQQIGYLSLYGPREAGDFIDWQGRGTTSLRLSEDGKYEEQLLRGFMRWFDQMWEHGSVEYTRDELKSMLGQ